MYVQCHMSNEINNNNNNNCNFMIIGQHYRLEKLEN